MSGSSIGKNATKLVGCEGLNCQFMLADKVNKLASKEMQLKTGSDCPLCSGKKSVRLFDSRAEFQRAQELKMLVKDHKISDLQYQVRFPLHVTAFDGKKKLLYTYVSDFTYVDHENEVDEYVVEDVKNRNVISDVAAIKLKHFAIEFGFEVRIVTR